MSAPRRGERRNQLCCERDPEGGACSEGNRGPASAAAIKMPTFRFGYLAKKAKRGRGNIQDARGATRS